MEINVKRTSSVRFGLFVFVICVCLSMCSCSSSRIANPVSRIAVDTIYLSNQQYDSIYIYKDVYRDRSKDTIYLKDISIEYRYKMLKDTICIIQRDSIPYEVTVIETKEISRPLTLFDKLCRLCFYVLSGVLFFWTYAKARKIYDIIRG